MPPPRRLKVALIVYRDDPSSGGALRVAQAIAQYLPTDQIETHLVFAYGGPGAIAGSVTCPTHFLQAASSRDWQCWKKTRQWFRTMRFDVLHFIDSVNWVLFATLGIRSKRILHFHGCPYQETMSAQDQMMALTRRWLTDAGMAITHGAKRGVARLGWMSAAKVHVVQNGVNPEQFQNMPSKKEARQQLGVPLDVNLFGEVARFSYGSGLLEILTVLKHLPDTWHALLVGDGPLRPELEKQAKEQGLAHRLHMPGLLSDVRPAYAAFDVVILLARYQSFCLMLAEAMLAEVPIVGLQGAGEYTEKEYPLITSQNAIFFPRVNPWDFDCSEPDAKYQQVAQAMQDTLIHSDETKQRVQLAKAWVMTRFSAQRQARRCMEVYREVSGISQGAPCES
ncbi:MAG: glycosyltransferase family 4 protein [Gemmatales bacterium]